MAALITQDRDCFIEAEKQEREARLMPPFGRLGAVVISGTDLHRVEQVAKGLGRSAPHHPDITVLGPVPAPLAQLRGRHRWRLLVKATKSAPLQQIFTQWIGCTKIPSTVRVTVDIDPYNFL